MDEHRSSRTALLTAIFAVGAVLSSVLGGSSVHDGPRASTTFAMLLLIVLAARMLSGGAIDRVQASLALVTTSLPIAALAVLDAERPIIAAWRYEPHEAGHAVALLALTTPAIVALTTWVGFFAVRRGFALVVRRGRVVQVAAWVTIASAAISLAFAAGRAGGVAAEDYGSSLPIFARLPAGCGEQNVRAGTLLIHRDGASGDCRQSDPPSPWDCRIAFGPEAAAPARALTGVGFHWCHAVVVRADEKRRTWVIEDEVGQRLAYDAEHLDQPTALRASRVAGALRAPDVAVGLAALGALAAIAAINLPRRSLVSGDHGTLHDAIARPDGMLYLADGSAPLSLPSALRSMRGPVVVELTEAPTSRLLLPGTLGAGGHR